jgi:hypothetical protein
VICSYPRSSTKKIQGKKYHYDFPCGQCLPCKITKRQEWTGRILLESLRHERSFFITLTYDSENLPHDGSLSKRDLQLFFMRLRKRLGRFRYFAVGEYGTKTQRAHYHAIIFGLSEHLLTDKSLSEIWGKGFTSLAEFTLGRAEYVANYTTKKLSDSSREARPSIDCTKEFSLQSRKPPIGHWFNEAMEKAITKAAKRLPKEITQQDILGLPISDSVKISGQDIQCFRLGGKTYPLGRTAKRYIRRALGITDQERYAIMDLKHKEVLKDPILRAEKIHQQKVAIKNAKRKKRKIKNRNQL